MSIETDVSSVEETNRFTAILRRLYTDMNTGKCDVLSIWQEISGCVFCTTTQIWFTLHGSQFLLLKPSAPFFVCVFVLFVIVFIFRRMFVLTKFNIYEFQQAM